MEKFGYPDTLIREYEYWSVQLRPEQVTLGSLVLCNNEPVTQFSQVSTGAFTELQYVISGIEAALANQFDYDKINYLMLMMIDPDVHFHVIPRYAAGPSFKGITFEDAGWPGPPQLATPTTTDENTFAAILQTLRSAW